MTRIFVKAHTADDHVRRFKIEYVETEKQALFEQYNSEFKLREYLHDTCSNNPIANGLKHIFYDYIEGIINRIIVKPRESDKMAVTFLPPDAAGTSYQPVTYLYIDEDGTVTCYDKTVETTRGRGMLSSLTSVELVNEHVC